MAQPTTRTANEPVVQASEGRGERARRHGRRGLMYFWLVWLLALFVILVALIVANTRAVELDWLVGSSRSSLVWIILVSALIGWVLGLVTSVVFRHQTRRRAPAA